MALGAIFWVMGGNKGYIDNTTSHFLHGSLCVFIHVCLGEHAHRGQNMISSEYAVPQKLSSLFILLFEIGHSLRPRSHQCFA